MRVLLADAEEVLSETLQSFLWDRGYEAEVVANAAECLTVLHEFQPRFLVLNDNLPNAGTDEVLEQLVADRTLSTISVILVTTGVNEDKSTFVASSLAIGQLRKPFKFNELLLMLSVVNDQ